MAQHKGPRGGAHSGAKKDCTSCGSTPASGKALWDKTMKKAKRTQGQYSDKNLDSALGMLGHATKHGWSATAKKYNRKKK